MPEIKSLKGIRYNPERIKITDVLTQPYDQITDEMARDYKNRSPYNFVRLVLTKYAEGHNRQNEYKEAKKFIEVWLKEKIFIQDEECAIYPYWQEFSIDNKNYSRKAFISLVRLEELGKGNILPHEKTLSKPKEDRLNLLRITKKDLEPVFLLYTDPKNYVNNLLEERCQDKPLIDVKDDRGVTHKLWRITNPDLTKQVIKTLKDSIFVIADGHHRYETAFNYRNELASIAEDHPANYKMIGLVNIEDPGLVILPTHRLIKNLPDFTLENFLQGVRKFFEVEKTDKVDIVNQLQRVAGPAFGFYHPKGASILRLKSLDTIKEFLPDRSEDYHQLDVVILHTLLIEHILGIKPTEIEDYLRYERGVDKTIKRVDAGEFQCGILMNPTRPEQVKKVAQHHERMPQKSTDFYPKLISGLVFYDVAGT